MFDHGMNGHGSNLANITSVTSAMHEISATCGATVWVRIIQFVALQPPSATDQNVIHAFARVDGKGRSAMHSGAIDRSGKMPDQRRSTQMSVAGLATGYGRSTAGA
jgi:hypothetical protein